MISIFSSVGNRDTKTGTKTFLAGIYSEKIIRDIFSAGLFLFLLLGVVGASSAKDNWTLGGSLRSLNLYSDESPENYYPSFRFTNNVLRLEAFWEPVSPWQFDFAGNLQLLGRDPEELYALEEYDTNRRIDLEHVWSMTRGWDGLAEMDRFSLRWSGNKSTITVGRQAIGFGRIAIFSPLDVIAPFPPDVLDSEYRPGIDALRMSTYYSQSGKLELVTVVGDSKDNNSYLLTWEENLNGVDLLATGGLLRERPMVGIGLSGNVGLVGLKGEASFYEGRNVGEPGGDPYNDFIIGAVELWYRFDIGVTLITEYLHNGAGEKDPQRYFNSLFSAPHVEGFAPLLGKDYLLLSGNYQLHPLVDLNGLFIWNLHDDSWLLRPTLDVSLADNMSLSLFLTCPAGDSADNLYEVRPQSEFGSQGVSGGIFLKYFFSL